MRERGGLFSPQSLVSASCRVETYLDRLHTVNTVTVWLCAARQWAWKWWQLTSYEAAHCKGPMYILNWVKGDPVTVWVTALTLHSIHWLFGPSVSGIFSLVFYFFFFYNSSVIPSGMCWFMSFSGWVLDSLKLLMLAKVNVANTSQLRSCSRVYWLHTETFLHFLFSTKMATNATGCALNTDKIF